MELVSYLCLDNTEYFINVRGYKPVDIFTSVIQFHGSFVIILRYLFRNLGITII
jgi:hypothetical protein